MKKILILSLNLMLATPLLYAQNGALGNKLVEGAIIQPQMDGAVIAAHYREWTGKRIIVSNAAQAKAISFIQPGPMTYAEAAKVLQKACLLEGLVFVDSGPNEMKLVLAQQAKQQGIPFLKEGEDLPTGDAVVSYFMRFDHISPSDGLEVFQSVIGATQSHGSVSTVPNANALVITESSSLIRTLLELKEEIDIPQSRVSQKMISLNYADAEQLVELLTPLVSGEGDQGNGGRAPAPRPNANNNQGGLPNGIANAQQQAQSSGGGVAAPPQQVTIIPNTRTNSIFVTGRPIDIILTEALIQEFDQPAKKLSLTKFKLNYIAVGEFLPVASDAIKRVSATSGDGANGGNAPVNNNQPPQQNNNNNNNGGDGARGVSLADTERSETPQSLLVGKTQLVADNTNNTLIVEGSPQSLEIIRNLIREMDVPSKQVQITALFGRYTIDGENTFGVDFARAFTASEGSSGLAGESSTGGSTLLDPGTLTGPALFPGVANGLNGIALFGRIGSSFFASLQALESTGKFKLLSRPTLFTTNNRKAVLSSGQRIAVPTSTLSSSGVTDGTTVSQNTNIEFRDVLLKLEVIPLVNSDNEVTLKISFVNEDVVGSQIISGNTIPTIGTEELFTTVKVPNNGTVLLGGLITENSADNKTGVPILSRIPGLGKIFSSTSKVTSKEELVIMIQPKIVDGTVALGDLQDYNASRSGVTSDVLAQEYRAQDAYANPSLNQAFDDTRTPQAVQQAAQQALKKSSNIQSISPRNRYRGNRR